MWPLTLDLTRDECRGILRRSELESYSSIISTFRAQGELTDEKLKILQDLRDIFHITLDRHRAEARRVSNDERLSTIAEIISGPNTGQEWSKEGHRTFPLLPRTAPHTALLAIANNAVKEAAKDNSKLPMPFDTKRDCLNDDLPVSDKPIVTEDPLLQTGSLIKQVLKRSRSISESSNHVQQLGNVGGAVNRKRITDTPDLNHTNVRIQQLYNSHSKPYTPPSSSQTQQRKVQSKRMSTKGKQSKQSHQKSKNDTPNTVVKQKTPKLPSTKSSKYAVDKNTMDESFMGGRISLPQQQHHQHVQHQQQGWNQSTDILAQPSIAVIQHHPSQQQQQQQQPPPPVQIIYTTQVENISTENSTNLMDSNSKTNLITESTPITWITKPTTPVTSTTAGRPIKMILPSSRKVTTTQKLLAINNARNTIQSTKQLKNARRKVLTTGNINIIEHHAGLLDTTPQPINTTVNKLTSQLIKPLAPTNTLPEPLQIQSITTISGAYPIQNISSTNVIHGKKSLQLSGNDFIKTSSQQQQQLQLQQQQTQQQSQSTLAIGASTTPKQKIHVTSNQLISPATNATLKLSPHTMQIKSFQSKGNVKLIPSSDGRMIIKSTNTDASTGTAVGNTTVPGIIKNITDLSSNNHKISLQKVQLMPSKKQPVGKTNMIVMQKIVSGGGGVGKAIALKDKILLPSKTNKFQFASVSTTPIQTTVLGQSQSNQNNQSNVIVLDVCDSSNQNIDRNNLVGTGLIQTVPLIVDNGSTVTVPMEKNVITEDTPVDILSTDAITNNNILIDLPVVADAAAIAAVPSDDTQQLELKNKTQIMRHLKSVTTVQSIPIPFNNTTTITNAAQLQQPHRLKKTTNIRQKLNVIQNNNRPKNNTVKMNTHRNVLTIPKNTSVVDVIDWEDELDQANKDSNIVTVQVPSLQQPTTAVAAPSPSISTTTIVIQDDDDNKYRQENDEISNNICPNETTDDDLIQYEEEDVNNAEQMEIDISKSNIVSTTTTNTISINQNQQLVTSSSTTTALHNNNTDDELDVSKMEMDVDNDTNNSYDDNEFKKSSDNNSVMLQMQEYDENGSSQMRNVSVEELVASGHIILDASDSNE